VGLENITMGCPTSMLNLLALGWASHGYILRALMNKHTLLNNVKLLLEHFRLHFPVVFEWPSNACKV